MPTKRSTASKSPSEKSKKVAPKAETFTCDYCEKAFKRESAFITHMCEKKRRWMAQDEKANKIGFMVFHKLYARNYRTLNKPRSYADFVKSNLYKVLVAFGKYVHDINAVRPDYFIEFLIKTEVPVDSWISPRVYETYIRELNKKETPDAALERNFLLMQEWAVATGEIWTDFFRKVPATQATHWIISGRISPWVLYVAPSAMELMTRLSEEQMTLVQSRLEPRFWEKKLNANAAKVDMIREELAAAGL